MDSPTDNYIGKDEEFLKLLEDNKNLQLKVAQLEDENQMLKTMNYNAQVIAEHEEEQISNKLLRKIHTMNTEKEKIIQHYESEEEHLTIDLTNKMQKLQQEKLELEHQLKNEQEHLVENLMRRTEELEKEIKEKEYCLDQVRREKIELESTLEKEQESFVNRLWKKLTKLENENRNLVTRMNPDSAESIDQGTPNQNMELKNEIDRLKSKLAEIEEEHSVKLQQYLKEELEIKEENKKLKERLAFESFRLSQLSESESSVASSTCQHSPRDDFDIKNEKLPPN